MEAKLLVPGVCAWLGRMKPVIIMLLAFTKLTMQMKRDYAAQHALSKLVLGKKELKGKKYPKELLTLLFEKNWFPETIKAVNSQGCLEKKHG